MTVLVGVLCKDSVVIGADSSATFSSGQQCTVEQQTKKLFILDEKVIVACTGAVGLGQRFCHIIQNLCDGEMFQKAQDHVQIAKQICVSTITDFSQTSAPKGQFGALVAFPFKNKPYLVEFSIQDLQPEFKDEHLWYASLGSGQAIADPFLGLMRKVYCPESPPDLATGLFMTNWALCHVVEVNPGGIKDPLFMATLEKDERGQYKAYEIPGDDMAEHQQSVDAAYKHMSEFINKFDVKNAPDIPIPDTDG